MHFFTKSLEKGNNCLAYFFWSYSVCIIYLFATEKHCVFPAEHQVCVIGTMISVAFFLFSGSWIYETGVSAQSPHFLLLRVGTVASFPMSCFNSALLQLVTKTSFFFYRGHGCDEVTHREHSSKNRSEANMVLKVGIVLCFFFPPKNGNEFKLWELSWII